MTLTSLRLMSSLFIEPIKCRLNHGLPQGFVVAPIIFNLYISDIPPTNCRHFMYIADTTLATQLIDLDKCKELLMNDLIEFWKST